MSVTFDWEGVQGSNLVKVSGTRNVFGQASGCLSVCMVLRGISVKSHLKEYFYILWHFILTRGLG